MVSVGQQSQPSSLLSPWRRAVSCPFSPAHAWGMGQRSRWHIYNTQHLPPAAEGSQDGCCPEGKQEWGLLRVSAEQCVCQVRISVPGSSWVYWGCQLLSTLWPPAGPSLPPQLCQAAIWARWVSCCLISLAPRVFRQMDLPLADGWGNIYDVLSLCGRLSSPQGNPLAMVVLGNGEAAGCGGWEGILTVIYLSFAFAFVGQPVAATIVHVVVIETFEEACGEPRGTGAHFCEL